MGKNGWNENKGKEPPQFLSTHPSQVKKELKI